MCVPDKSALRRANVYGLTQRQYEEMLASQDNRCAICRTSFNGMSSKLIHIDHCHETGVVRGVLCKGCNLGLGWFKQLELLKNAVNYLACTHDRR